MKKYPLLRLIGDCKRQWGWLSLFVFSYFLAGLFKSQIALLVGKMTDAAVSDSVNGAMAFILPLGFLLFLEWLRGILNYILTAQTSERMFFDLKLRVFDKLSRMRMTVVENQLRAGDVVSRVNNDLNGLCETFAGTYTWYMRVFFTAVIAFISCVQLSWELSLVYFILMPPVFFLMQRMSAPLKKQQTAILKRAGQGMNAASEMVGANEVVKSFQLESEMNARYGQIIDNAAEIEIESEKINMKMVAIKYIGMILPMVTMFVFGILLVNAGRVTPGTVIAFSALCGQVRALLELYNLMIGTFRKSTATCERIYEILDLPEEESGNAVHAGDEDVALWIQGLSFAYPDGLQVFDGFDFQVRQGEQVALVGKSGCGKSTLLKLICKFYDETAGGSFQIFGTERKDWENAALRKKIALVSQDAFLFQDTIYQNVLIGKPEAKEQEVIDAMKAANIWDFVDKLPQKAETRVGDGGVPLSGGQRQRIAIARAFLKNAPLVLLDEPTSALDRQSEQEVQNALGVLLKNRTAIVIAHRLYTLKDMDRICVMENGKIVEEGTWEHLVELDGVFHNLLKKGGMEE